MCESKILQNYTKLHKIRFGHRTERSQGISPLFNMWRILVTYEYNIASIKRPHHHTHQNHIHSHQRSFQYPVSEKNNVQHEKRTPLLHKESLLEAAVGAPWTATRQLTSVNASTASPFIIMMPAVLTSSGPGKDFIRWRYHRSGASWYRVQTLLSQASIINAEDFTVRLLWTIFQHHNRVPINEIPGALCYLDVAQVLHNNICSLGRRSRWPQDWHWVVGALAKRNLGMRSRDLSNHDTEDVLIMLIWILKIPKAVAHHHYYLYF